LNKVLKNVLTECKGLLYTLEYKKRKKCRDSEGISLVNSVKARKSYTALIDEEVLPYIHEGDVEATEYILKKYEGIVYKKASGYFLMGSDRDDVVQEGRIGLYKAIADYDATKKSSFKSFAELCITRQIITSIKSATRLKHSPLNSYISIYKPVHEEEETRTLLDTLRHDGIADPLEKLLNEEKFNNLKTIVMKALTRLEWRVLYYYMHGYSYEEIALKLNRQEKSIDNALQRVRRKVDKLVENGMFAEI